MPTTILLQPTVVVVVMTKGGISAVHTFETSDSSCRIGVVPVVASVFVWQTVRVVVMSPPLLYSPFLSSYVCVVVCLFVCLFVCCCCCERSCDLVLLIKVIIFEI
jgi:hypothetical protein